jgi:hypothetical protein
VVELRVHVVAAPVACGAQVAAVGLADKHAHVRVQVALRGVAVRRVTVEDRVSGRRGRALSRVQAEEGGGGGGV